MNALSLRRLALAGAVLYSAILAPTLAYAQNLYGLSSSTPGSLYTIDEATGAATFSKNLSGSTFTAFVGLSFLGGNLYASDVVDTGTGIFSFGSIDLTTGAFTAIHDQEGSSDWHGLTSNESAGVLYTVDNDFFARDSFSLKSVTTSGAITTIGRTNQFVTGLAYDNANGILYGSTFDQLFTIDTTTGAATLVGDFSLPNPTGREGLEFDSNTGVLYINSVDSLGAGSLFTVNKATGAATLVGANGPTAGSGIDSLAFRSGPAAVTPEGSSLLMLVAGGLPLALIPLWRRRRAA